MTKRIGVLTAGGDAPGQNVCLKSITYHAVDRGYDVIGIRKGWEGLLGFDPDDVSTHGDQVISLTKMRVRDIDRMPGSFLHASRLDPSSVSPKSVPGFLQSQIANQVTIDLTAHIKRVLDTLHLDALIVLGDAKALQYAARLNREGVPIIGIPKTVHNNVNGSEYSLGFSTALGRGVRFVQEIRAMAGSREEIAVIEILGRSSGLPTMLIGFLAGSDRTLIPEVSFDPGKLAELLLEDQHANPANYALLTMSEAASIEPEIVAKYVPTLSRLAEARAQAEAVATNGQGLSREEIVFELVQDLSARVGGSGAAVVEMLENITGKRILFQPMSYLLRTGEPDGQDLLGAANFAAMSVNLFAQDKTGLMVAYRRRENYIPVPLDVVNQTDDQLNLANFYDAEAYQAKPSIIWAARV